MAALPLCASRFPPSAVAVASHSARPASSVTHFHSLGRRGPSPLLIRIQARTRASHLRSPKAADRDHHGQEPQPKPERGDNEPDAREAPDMFRIEKDEILNYINCTRMPCRVNIQDLRNKVLALFVCAQAQEALDLASKVMDLTYIESSHNGRIQLFDQNKANKVIRMCTSTFCHVAKAAYLNRIETDTVLSFLDALRGLAVFCDTLFQQIVFKLKDGPLKNSVSYTMGTHSRNFDKEMKRLKEEFILSMTTHATAIKHSYTTMTDATAIKHMVVMDTLSGGMEHTQSYIPLMIPHWSLLA